MSHLKAAKVLRLEVNPAPAEPIAVPRASQLKLTRALARAMTKQQRAEALLRAATAEVDAAFGPWAAGRKIARDEAREQLISTGFLPRRRVWE